MKMILKKIKKKYLTNKTKYAIINTSKERKEVIKKCLTIIKLIIRMALGATLKAKSQSLIQNGFVKLAVKCN